MVSAFPASGLVWCACVPFLEKQKLKLAEDITGNRLCFVHFSPECPVLCFWACIYIGNQPWQLDFAFQTQSPLGPLLFLLTRHSPAARHVNSIIFHLWLGIVVSLIYGLEDFVRTWSFRSGPLEPQTKFAVGRPLALGPWPKQELESELECLSRESKLVQVGPASFEYALCKFPLDCKSLAKLFPISAMLICLLDWKFSQLERILLGVRFFGLSGRYLYWQLVTLTKNQAACRATCGGSRKGP